MLSGKAQGGVQPYAYGSMLQAATYGATIPVGYGMTISPFLAIWAANLRQGGPGTKKGKSGKKGPPSYTENIDFVLGHNPIVGVNQLWNNGSTIPLNYTSQTFIGPGPWTITDPHFFAVIGVSVTESYAVSFNDYGGSPVSETGNYQVPLWNELMTGPDPVRNSGYRNYPFCYKWQPSYGATVQADATDIFAGAQVTIYYAQLTAATSFQSPLARNYLQFENELGNGDEYTGNFTNTSTPLSSQQILYPMYAGAGSATIDLGSGGVIPSLQAEVQFKWGLYSTGDADFADMIEDIFKSGLAQAVLGASGGTLPNTRVEHGLSCYNFPGCSQMKCLNGASSSSLAPIEYNLSVTEGNFLVVIGVTNDSGSGALSISDSAGNSYTAAVSGVPGCQVWYAQANATGTLTVTVSGQGNSWSTALLEVAGVDTFDSVSVGVGGNTSITSTNAQGFPGYLLSAALYPGASVAQPTIPLWTLLTPPNYYGVSPAQGFSLQEMRVSSPTGFTLSVPSSGLAASLILAFKCVQPPAYPQPVGDFLDLASLDKVRLQCRANGLWGSLSMSSQQAASDYLTTLYTAADAAAVFLGFRLFSMPLSEVSAVGNGAVYVAPTSGGPVINLSTENGDFLAGGGDSGGSAPIEIKTAARVNQPNVLQMQCISRTSNYNPSVVEQPDQGSIALYGIRKSDPVQNYAIQDVGIARQLLAISVRKLQYGGDVYTFQLPAKWCLLAPYGAGGGGNYFPALSPLSLPSPAPSPIPAGTSVAWAVAQAYSDPQSFNNAPSVFNDNLGCSGSAAATNAGGGLNMTNGQSFGGPNQLTLTWGQFAMPPEIPKGATITGIYAVAVVSGNFGGSMEISSSPGGVIFGGSAGGTHVGPSSGTDLGAVSITATLQNTVPGAANLSMNIPLIALAVYYTGGAQQQFSTRAFSPSGPATLDGVITITDPLADINEIPVRITSISESTPNGPLDVEAEPFVYGMYNPSALPVDTPTPFAPNPGVSAGDVNAPVIFQPTSALQGLNNQAQLWMAVSSPSIYYGGAQVFVSTDGGSSYTPLGDPIVGSATTGVTTADWPAAPSPDTTNNLALDLTESAPVGTLQSYSVATQDGYQYPCYVATAAGGGYGYELMTYGVATLTSANKYTLMATGSGNHLDRGVFGAPEQGQGVDHPSGSRFAFLNPNSQGILKVALPAQWIGVLLYFKICSYNTFGAATQSLSDVSPYTFTPVAAPPASGGAAGVQLFLVNGQ